MAVIKDKKCMIIGAAPLASGAVFEEFDPKEHYVICADAGYDTAVQYGIRPDLVIGDFDSAAEAEAYFAEAYLSRPDELAARGVFVENAAGEVMEPLPERVPASSFSRVVFPRPLRPINPIFQPVSI